jgi:hypothetical protein
VRVQTQNNSWFRLTPSHVRLVLLLTSLPYRAGDVRGRTHSGWHRRWATADEKALTLPMPPPPASSSCSSSSSRSHCHQLRCCEGLPRPLRGHPPPLPLVPAVVDYTATKASHVHFTATDYTRRLLPHLAVKLESRMRSGHGNMVMPRLACMNLSSQGIGKSKSPQDST